jgi:hypothetical protein
MSTTFCYAGGRPEAGPGRMEVGATVQALTRRCPLTDGVPVSYLYHLHRDLNPVDLAERLRLAVARFAPPGS